MKNILKTSVAAGALFALAAPVGTAQAEFKNQNSKVNLTIGGQIVRSLLWVDDGEHEQMFHVDGRTAGTRLRYIVSGQLTESVKVGGLIEHEVGQSNDSFTFGNTTGNDASVDTTAFGIRHHFVSFQHKSMGKISLGQTNTASNGTMEQSLTGTGNMVLTGATMLGQIEFTTGANGAFSGTTASAETSTLDGLSRDDVIRYDTPTFGGFKLATSMQDEGTFDVAAFYSGKVAGLSVKAATHFANTAAGGNSKQWGVAGSVKHDSGFALRANFGRQTTENSGVKTKVWMVGGSYAAKLSSLGNTIFFVEYYNAEDVRTAGNEMDTLYIGAVQKLDSIGSEMGIVYGNHSLDDTAGTDFNDIDAVMFQTKLNF